MNVVMDCPVVARIFQSGVLQSQRWTSTGSDTNPCMFLKKHVSTFTEPISSHQSSSAVCVKQIVLKPSMNLAVPIFGGNCTNPRSKGKKDVNK